MGAAATLCGIVIGGNGDGGNPSTNAAGTPGVVVPVRGTKLVHKRKKMYSNLPGVYHALPEAALPW